MDKNTVWRHIHEQRAALAALLRTLTAEQWEHPTLCPGWTVRDVAAHLISTPQVGLVETLRMAPSMARGYNRAIFLDVKRRGQAPVAEILQDFETYAGSRHHVPVTTHVEPMLDVLVHTQDIVRPLGLRHDMPPDAAAVAADRARLLSFLMGSRRIVRGVRMVATDTDWVRGHGPVVEGPVQELLMLCSGRAADASRLTGDGTGRLTQAV
jgi:uncharacterized protein (TIGR03083 family)